MKCRLIHHLCLTSSLQISLLIALYSTNEDVNIHIVTFDLFANNASNRWEKDGKTAYWPEMLSALTLRRLTKLLFYVDTVDECVFVLKQYNVHVHRSCLWFFVLVTKRQLIDAKIETFVFTSVCLVFKEFIFM